MSSPSLLAAALAELTVAIDGVERAVLRQATKADLVSELALMRADRNKLAEALDEALMRTKALDAARVTAADKVEAAMTSLRGLLAKETKD
jgi:predicted amino acid-binding ACT domain protein